MSRLSDLRLFLAFLGIAAYLFLVAWVVVECIGRRRRGR
jgi:hypothetical protein